ncbi:MAG: ribosomal protein S18-alanine N-acetyltransferase [Desulfuromusa sp.]|jgi:ribosomal-protein-alanine N-acetyltransferase|nr:ribosomal protein S18-alanine N-acetyltransferase [Desulfuromusa sp.]
MTVANNSIRLMQETDLDCILLIEQDCYSHPWSFRQFSQELENPVASVLVYEIEGQIAGFICYWLIAGEMQILNLATSPQQRRIGIAAQLLDEAFKRCSRSELSSAWLEVRSGNLAAIALYQRYGFKLNGTRSTYYPDGEDALVMVKLFTE